MSLSPEQLAQRGIELAQTPAGVDVHALQAELVAGGWLGGFTPGVYDDATTAAVAAREQGEP